MHTTAIDTLAPGPRYRPKPSGNIAGRMVDYLKRRAEYRRQMYALAQLDDRLLKDIGLPHGSLGHDIRQRPLQMAGY